MTALVICDMDLWRKTYIQNIYSKYRLLFFEYLIGTLKVAIYHRTKVGHAYIQYKHISGLYNLNLVSSVKQVGKVDVSDKYA